MDKLLLLFFYAPIDYSCPVIVLEIPNEKTELDDKYVEEAEIGCYKRFGNRSPCLIKLQRNETNDYSVTCGFRKQ